VYISFGREKTIWKNVRLSERGHQFLVRLKRRMRATSYSEVIERLAVIYIKYEILRESFPEVAAQVDKIFEERLSERRGARAQVSPKA